MAALEQFVRKGGQLISAEKSATLDEQGAARQLPSFFRNTTGPGRGMHLEQVPPIEELAKILRAASASPISLEAPPGVLYNVTEQEDRRRVIVHILNYTLAPVTNLKLEVAGTYRAGRAVSPDDGGSFTISSGFGPKSATIQIPRLQIYTTLVLDR